MMLLILATGVLIVTFLFTLVAVWCGRLKGRNIIMLGVLGVMLALVILNLPDLTGLVLKSGDKDAYSLQLQRVERAAQQVQTDTTEVRVMKEQIEALVKRVEQGEQTISQMHNMVEESDQQLGNVQQHMAPRRIDLIEGEVLIAKLKTFAGQEYELVTLWDMKEPRDFTESVHQTLDRAGWKYIPPEHGSFLVGVEGLRVFVHPQAEARTQEASKALVSALETEGLEVSIKAINSATVTNRLTLHIGTKP